GICDFFSGGSHGRDRYSRTLRREESERFEHDEGTHSVVERPADDPAVGKLHYTRGKDAGIADPHAALRLDAARSPDVDPQVFGFGDLVPVVLLHEVNGAFPNDPRYRAVATEQEDPLSHEDLMVPSADSLETQVSLVIDVGDHYPDLIDVASEHDSGGSLGIEYSERIAADVRAHAIGEALGFGTPDSGGQGLEG